MINDEPPRVFISYAHEPPEHKAQVLRFATYLREQIGLDAHLDTWYDNVRRDWSNWAIEQLDKADFILVVASPEYRRRADGMAPPDVGRGSQFEAAIIRDNLTRNLRRETERVLPVVLPGGSIEDIPRFLNAHSTTRYEIATFSTTGVAELLTAITGKGQYPMPERGEWRGAAATGPQSDTPASGPVDLAHGFPWAAYDPDIWPGAAWIAGDYYGTSIILRPTSFATNAPGFVEFDLAGRYHRLTATAGVLDDAVETDQVGVFQLFLDGRPQPELRTALGEPAAINVDVTGVRWLRLEMHRPHPHDDRPDGGLRSSRLPELACGNPTLR